MKNKYTYILILFAFNLLFSCNNDKKLNSELNKIAENLNQSAPTQLDEHTLFLGADVTNENIFRYRYQIVNSDQPQLLMDAMEQQTRANIKEAFRMNHDLRIFTDNNVEINYIYTDSVGETIRIIYITPEDYK